MTYRRLEPYLLFLLISIIWGASFMLMKKAGLAFGPITIGAGRVLGGAIAIGLVLLYKRKPWKLAKSYWIPLMGMVLVGCVWPYTIQPYLIHRNGSGFIGMMVSFVPLLTILVSIPMLGIFPSRRQVMGVVGGLVCIGIILSDGLGRQMPPLDLAGAMTVPLAYALTNTYLKQRFVGVSALTLSFNSLVLASILLWPIVFALPSEHVRDSREFVFASLCVATLGILGTGAATYMFYRLIQEHGPLFAGMVTYLVPIGAIVMGWLDSEKVTALQILALGGIFLMVALVQCRAAFNTRATDLPTATPKE